MNFENDEFEVTPENRKSLIEHIFKDAILKLKNDSHIKLISLKTDKVKKDDFLKKVICKPAMIEVIQSFFDKEGCETGSFILHKQMYPELIDAVLKEWKQRIFSSLSDDGIMGLYFDTTHDKIFWAFPDDKRKIPNEKDILKPNRRKNET